jgi:hypothetical protein
MKRTGYDFHQLQSSCDCSVICGQHWVKRLDVLQGPWKGRVPADAGVVLEIDVERVTSGNRSSHTDSGESALDSRCVSHVKDDDLLL